MKNRSNRLVLGCIGLGLLHHADHVLRVDHSGWPFTDRVSPFTFSLLVYPLLLVALFLKSRSWLRATAMALVCASVVVAHTFLETPTDQFGTWARNASSAAWCAGQPNLLNVKSSALGSASVVLSLLLSAMLLAATASLLIEARIASRLQHRS